MNKNDLEHLRQSITILRNNKINEVATPLETVVEKYENGNYQLDHNFRSDELYEAVVNNKFNKEETYSYMTWREQHGEYTLSISGELYGEDEDLEFQYYLDEEQAKEDMYELERLGYTIKHPEEK